jgi:hypothetical protein
MFHGDINPYLGC